jgi:uncharacterized protein
MTTTSNGFAEAAAIDSSTCIISADSHVHEPPTVWLEVPQQYKERAAQIGQQSDLAKGKPGGMDPRERVKEMVIDGVSAEVLYPTTGIRLYDIDDHDYQAALFRAYNDWLIDYCSYAPDRLVGLPLLPLYNIDDAVKELERCRKNGLHGAMVWVNPPADRPFTSDYYDRLWDAAEALDAPINLHTVLHIKSHPSFQESEDKRTKESITRYVDAANALFDIVTRGVLESHPRLKLVLVEFHIGWIPFILQQWDDALSKRGVASESLPSRIFEERVFATFIHDEVGGKLLSHWGQDQCMWSSDYPHGASKWPYSRQSIATQLGHLDKVTLKKVLQDNVVRLYPEALGHFA